VWQWVKVKHRDTVDVVCGAVIGSRARREAWVVGLPINGELRIVGRSSPLPAATARTLEATRAPNERGVLAHQADVERVRGFPRLRVALAVAAVAPVAGRVAELHAELIGARAGALVEPAR